MAIVFYQKDATVYAVHYQTSENPLDVNKLEWLFSGARKVQAEELDGTFIGPRREMITPWSTNAVEITQNMGIDGIVRIEEFIKTDDEKAGFDPMLQASYKKLDQQIFMIDKQPEPVVYIKDIQEYNKQEGLALNPDEIAYLEGLEKKLGRSLTDSEVFGFSQVNSEHCRHKIFNGTFVIDGEEKETSLFKLIKKTSQENPNRIVSAYKDNCAFIEGPKVVQFAPHTHDKPDYFEMKDIDTVISLKAETHNFPTTVEPFNGAATGSGGEIRDRIAGGQAALPLAGTAVYMTSYPRMEASRAWEQKINPRKWLYQTPEDILIKASNGASDFGNKFGQPLICGSLLTFEHEENGNTYGYDKVIMQAGGIGFGNRTQALKKTPEVGEKVVLLGGDNYRIGMGGGAVSSVNTGVYAGAIELNAVQRSNPEMQKRVCNAIRALAESDENPIVSIHDHGAGGHLNCLSELVEETGGLIHMEELPVGDPTLSAKEIVGNESQERMGLVMKEKDVAMLQRIADRERAPMYVIGETTGDHRFTFENAKTHEKPIDLELKDMFGNPPKTIMEDKTVKEKYSDLEYSADKLEEYLEQVLQIEAVACKDWLTNKVDRSISGKVVRQQCVGPLHLPLSDAAAMALDYNGHRGIATSIGHAPVAAMANAPAGSRLAIAEALTNLVWAPIEKGLKGVSLSANWMWPCRNEGEDARLYQAVQAASDFAIELGVNIPTGKDSLSMTQKYDDKKVYAPGTVIISTVGEVSDFRKIAVPVLKNDSNTEIVYIDFSFDKLRLGGSSFAQILNKVGKDVPDVKDSAYFVEAFTAVQQLVSEGMVLAGHDISAGGMITALLEMCFADNRAGMDVDFSFLAEKDIIKILFAENPGVLLQIKDEDAKKVSAILEKAGVAYGFLGKPGKAGKLNIKKDGASWSLDIASLRDLWFKTSYLLERRQSGEVKALERYKNYKHNELKYKFPKGFTGKLSDLALDLNRKSKSGIRAAVIREKGCQCERESAWALHLAGFDVKDVHMTDLISGRETLEDVNMIVFVGGFSNSDVLGSAKGWAGAFKFNEKARVALENFYKREDTLSLGICNGCQLMVELGLIYPEHAEMPKMLHNDSHKLESGFVNVTIQNTNSVLLKTLEGARLGVWIAHGEGKFQLPYAESEYSIALKYSNDAYPGNPNGSAYATAGIVSKDGRHLAMMPHLERSLYPWNWAYYAEGREEDEVSPWIEAFINARKWIEEKVK
ncbi:MAG: phosphoribosylformylglycinamidine synthase [Odoribacter sp.]|nr:phosphoribosylformylglycinamidine synthase [Odoribacter sp.]MDY3033387.1 phosphoribosylformylglycinamidine synthase [Odoribacter sp.]